MGLVLPNGQPCWTYLAAARETSKTGDRTNQSVESPVEQLVSAYAKLSLPVQCWVRPSSSGRAWAGCHGGTGRAQTVSPQSFCHSSSRQWTQALRRITQLLFTLYHRHACVCVSVSVCVCMCVDTKIWISANLQKALRQDSCKLIILIYIFLSI